MTDEKTRALVLSVVKYGDHANVVRTFTAEHGLRAFMVNSLRSKKPGQFRPSMTLPMTSLELVLNPRSKGSLHRFSEVRPLIHWQSVHSDPIKMTLCTFAAEVVSKLVVEEYPDQVLFDDVFRWLVDLDSVDANLAMAPQRLLLIAAKNLGCTPHWETYQTGRLFDMVDGRFVDIQPDHSHWMDADESEALYRVSVSGERVVKSVRQRLLDELLGYVRIHHEPFGTLKSLELIRVLLS